MIGIIALNWDTAPLMVKLLESIKVLTYNEFSMVIIDNGSKMDDYLGLKNYIGNDERFKIFRNEKNNGFAVGNNQAINIILKNKELDTIFFINSDLYIKEDSWDKKFIDYFNDKEHIGILGAGLYPINWDKDANFILSKGANTYTECETVQGSFFAVRRCVLEYSLNSFNYVFDERFSPAYHEETELMLRMRMSGFYSAWIPVDHFHDSLHSATKNHAYHINEKCMNFKEYQDLKEDHRNLLLQIRSDFFSAYKESNIIEFKK